MLAKDVNKFRRVLPKGKFMNHEIGISYDHGTIYAIINVIIRYRMDVLHEILLEAVQMTFRESSGTSCFHFHLLCAATTKGALSDNNGMPPLRTCE
jgi:hypothetical protein